MDEWSAGGSPGSFIATNYSELDRRRLLRYLNPGHGNKRRRKRQQMIHQRAEEAEEQGEDVDALDDPNEGLTGDALIAAQKSMARRRRNTLLMVMTQYLHIFQKYHFQDAQLSEGRRHSMSTAFLARHVATSCGEADAEKAFTAGLLRFPLHMHEPHALPLAYPKLIWVSSF